MYFHSVATEANFHTPSTRTYSSRYLPAIHWGLPVTALVVAITDETILVGAHPVTTVSAALAGGGLLIPELEAELVDALGAMDRLDARKGREKSPRPVTIQGDRSLEFRLLQRVMYTCDSAGFDEMALAVIRESREEK